MQQLKNTIAILLPLFFIFVSPVSSASTQSEIDNAISSLQHRWAVIKYQTDEEQQETAYKALAEDAHVVSQKYVGHAEPLTWEAIILSTYAGAKGGLGALSLVEKARDLLLRAEKIDADTLQGSIYTTLGSLYYQVPGWPLGFGDDDKAREYLTRALQYNPDGIDPNFFYGDFLLGEGEYAKALPYLLKAEQAPARKGRELADEGRKKELVSMIKRAKENL
jgi:tetratricopeptide (TPR) repeat protein